MKHMLQHTSKQTLNLFLKLLIKFSILFLVTYNLKAAESSPVTTVESIYSSSKGNSPYIRFGANAMPGCYGNSGGYLDVANEKSADRTFSIILAAKISKQSVRVYYVKNNVDPDYNGWSLCTIEAIGLE
ncbi:hypothetical protein [Aliikangiella maris]|uniref:Discoidin domain-containing protein n=2 Tax=Aliikangiella maris TaxID=3162458 RepID=A0ABV3MU87_9GAMM